MLRPQPKRLAPRLLGERSPNSLENDENWEPTSGYYQPITKPRPNPEAQCAKLRKLKQSLPEAPVGTCMIQRSESGTMQMKKAPRESPGMATSLSDLPHFVLFQMLSGSDIGGKDLACLESAGYAFRRAADQTPYRYRSIAEMAAYEQCQVSGLGKHQL
jgi:hypothetical protein